MNNQDLIRLGVPAGDAVKLAYEHFRRMFAGGRAREQVEADIFNIVANPPAFFADELRAPLARAIYRPAFTPRAELPLRRLCNYRSAFGGGRYRARRPLRRGRGHRVPHEALRL